MKRVLILTTGGTIASTPEIDGKNPTRMGEFRLKSIIESVDLCGITCKALFNIDSSNIQPEHWLSLAYAINIELNNYDGFVITHGTDTMAYTSSMLSFLLGRIDKPVILTGSQLTLSDPDNDVMRNLIDAIRVAISGLIGVHIVFNGKIILGTRATKTRANNINAFDSINYPYIGFIENGNVQINNIFRFPLTNSIVFSNAIDSRVCLMKIIPGFRPNLLDFVTTDTCRGLVIEGFGLGGIPCEERSIIPAINRILSEGIPIVLTTQCLEDGADLSAYKVGRQAQSAGIISGFDMTKEAIVTKLMWILGHTDKLDDIKKLMITNFCGEITIT